MKRYILALSGLLLCAAAPTNAFVTPDSIPARDLGAAAGEPSLRDHLQLRREQAARLDTFAEDLARREDKQEAAIARWKGELARAQAPASFDERESARLLGLISGAREKSALDVLATRARALKSLSPVQRAQLESLSRDGRVRVRRDRYFQLLLAPVGNVTSRERAARPQQSQTRDRSARRPGSARSRRKGTVRYGAYGGYGYGGAQYGVGATYGRGPVGVHAGIGRGGPSVGVSIGGILGRGW